MKEKKDYDTQSVSSLNTSNEEIIHNGVAVLIRCAEHKRLALMRLPYRQQLWFPFAKTFQKENPLEAVEKVVRKTLDRDQDANISMTAPDSVQLTRFQVFESGPYYEVEIFSTVLDDKGCCKDTDSVQWYTNVSINEPNVWGPEPYVISEGLHHGDANFIGAIFEISVKDTKNILPKSSKDTHPYARLMIAAELKEKHVKQIFTDFIKFTFPSRAMNIVSFTEYMKHVGWAKKKPQCESLFRSFKTPKGAYVRVNEFVFGAAAYSRKTPHTDEQVVKLRARYIFDYYDDDGDHKLSPLELYNFHRDLLVGQNAKINEEEVLNATFKTCQAKKKKLKEYWSEDEFVSACMGDNNTRIIKGTTGICRAPINVVEKQYSTGQDLERIGALCDKHKPSQYSVALHEVTINKHGRIGEVIEIPEIQKYQSTVQRIASLELFNKDSAANRMLKILRENFASTLKGPQSSHRDGITAKELSSIPRQQFKELAIEIIHQFSDIVAKEPQILRINSPCYVMGDIHGNMHDLFMMERMLWKKAPVAEPGTFLFLGDYVDRGAYGVECVLYLFCMKILAKHQFYLLRGNHETRSLQKMFTFFDECTRKFGEDQTWEEFNKAFDNLSVCAVIDGKIFTAHGGIPHTTTDLSVIDIPKPLADPENTSHAAWEILWNDPASQDQLNDMNQMTRPGNVDEEVQNAAGFLFNFKRGTGYAFSQESVETFLQVNSLSHIIRAHEAQQEGYTIMHAGKTTTVFSTSNYSGGNNGAAAILVARQRLRPVKLGTKEFIGQLNAVAK